MKTFHYTGHRSIVADDEIENMKDAAEVFAGRKARAAFGRKGYARTCNLESWSQDGAFGEFNAFIGYRTGQHETTGYNVRFTVHITQ